MNSRRPISASVRSIVAGDPSAMPEIIAHRGASADAPENTLSAFHLAWEQGADGIEGDYRLTKDDEIVCIHDATTKRVAGVFLPVAKSNLKELKALDVGSWKGGQWKDERIPTIGEVFATVPRGKKVFIEIKCGPEIIPLLKRALTGSGLHPAQVVVIAFDTRVIAEAKWQMPELKALWLTSFRLDKATETWHPSTDKILATLERIHADGASCKSHTVIDHHFINEIRKAGKELHLWTINSMSAASRFQNPGIDSLTTNRPGWLRQGLAGRK